ncbi:hypothetical protein D3C87_1427170 [compost metagenome]
MTAADYAKDRARVAKIYQVPQKQEKREKLSHLLDLSTLEELNSRAEFVWSDQTRKLGGSARVISAMQSKTPPQEILQLAQELSGFLASSQAHFKQVMRFGSAPILSIHPLLVHLLGATIVSKGITVINGTRPGLFEAQAAHPFNIQRLFRNVANDDGRIVGVGKLPSVFVRQEARAMLLAMGLLRLLDISEFVALDYGTLQWVRLFIAQDLNSLSVELTGFSDIYYGLVSSVPGMTHSEPSFNSYNHTQAPKDERTAIAQSLTGYDYETFLRQMDRLSVGSER